MSKLVNLAKYIRSKNAGPFLVTLDIVFIHQQGYQQVVEANVLTKELVAGLYNLSEDQIVSIVHYDPAKSIKITLRREISVGGIGDGDIYGAQQHVPLLSIEIPANKRERT